MRTHLKLNLGLGNVLLASAAVGDLLGLGDLGADGLGGEVLERVALDGVDAQERAGLDSGESAGDCVFPRVSGPRAGSRGGFVMTYGRTACCRRSPQ